MAAETLKIVVTVCEGCTRKQPMYGSGDAPLPDGWTECGATRIPTRKKSALARWCPKCQQIPAHERLETLANRRTHGR